MLCMGSLLLWFEGEFPIMCLLNSFNYRFLVIRVLVINFMSKVMNFIMKGTIYLFHMQIVRQMSN